MRNADCSDSWVERSEWNAMRVLSLMFKKLFCFRVCVRASNMLFSYLAESGVNKGKALQSEFRKMNGTRQSVVVSFMFENLTFVGKNSKNGHIGNGWG